MKIELIAKYDSPKSFYHKAIVEHSVSGERRLYSYSTLVARVYRGKLTMCGPWDCSQTTRRHCKEFLSLWKNAPHGAAVRYDRGSCYGWGTYTICTLLMPIRMDDNNAYDKGYALKIQSDLLDKPEPAKPAEEPKPEAVQQETEPREQSLEY